MSSHETHRIVIVDDVPEIREILGFLLEESGWFTVVGEAGSGEDAVTVAVERHPDLILLDLDLPGMSGWDVLPILHERVPDSLVVVLSGSIEDRERSGAGDGVVQYASAVLEKGMSNRELINQLLDVLGRSRLEVAPLDQAPTQRAADLVDASAWLAAVVSASQDAVIGQTLDGTVVAWNPAAERLYGYTADEILGCSIRTIVPGDHVDEIGQILATLGAGERIDGYETVRLHKDGTRIDVQLTITPVIAQSGEVVGASVVARDVTSRRHTEAALVRAITQLERRNKELARSNEELDSFATVASHDLAQPLQVAYGFLDMFRTEYGDGLPEQGRAWLDSSLNSLERMRNLVRDILRYARTGSGEPKAEVVDLDAVVADALASLGVAIDDREATVTVDPDLPDVVGDRGQLTLVFQNLIANAVKFVPEGRSPVIDVTATSVDGDVTVRVRDNGVGVPAEQRTKVFEMFHRSSSTAAFAGTGLGLAIVRKIAVRHGGGVWIDDTHVGQGTTIAVRLPAAPSHR